MKRFFTLILILVLLCAAVPASAGSDYWKFTTYGSTEHVPDLFDGDNFSLDLYMNVTDLSAIIIETTFRNGKASTIVLRAQVKSKTTDNLLYFVLENGSIIKGHYDQNGYDFWMDFDGGSVRLHWADEFMDSLDYVGGKYAQEAP